MDADRLLRACGLDTPSLHAALDDLAAAGTIKTWACDAQTEELNWTPVPQSALLAARRATDSSDPRMITVILESW